MKRGASDHPKMADLRRILGISTANARGILEHLTEWTGRFAPRGNIGKYSDEAIAAGCRDEILGCDPARLLGALVDAGWIDLDGDHRLVVHDWYDHAQDHVHAAVARQRSFFVCGRAPKLRKLGEHERIEIARFYSENKPEPAPPKRRRRQSRAPDAPMGVMSGAEAFKRYSTSKILGTDQDTSYSLLEGESEGKPLAALAGESGSRASAANPRAGADPAGFERFWAIYPRKEAKARARKVWRRLRVTDELEAKIVAGVRRWSETEQWRRGVIPHPATFLNGERWTDEVTPEEPRRSGDVGGYGRAEYWECGICGDAHDCSPEEFHRGVAHDQI